MEKAMLNFIFIFILLHVCDRLFVTNAFVLTSRKHRMISLSFGSIYASKIIDLNDSNFIKLVRSNKPVLIDACAPWCGPCKLIEPVLERGAEKWSNSVLFARLDVDAKNSGIKLELLLQGVMPRS